jgi:23S rRNA (uracil1939-C5)-methyltransferase
MDSPDSRDSAAIPADWLWVESLDLDAQGVAHKSDGKVVFIEGALPFEYVSANINRHKNNWEQGTLTASAPCVVAAGARRIAHISVCTMVPVVAARCSICTPVHKLPSSSGRWKTIFGTWAKSSPEQILRPIEGPNWGYRFRARLSVRFVRKKGVVLVGFHERKSRYVADMQVCPILPPHVDAMLLPLRDLIGSMDAVETCPQIELACGDSVTALVLRHLEPLSVGDLARLRAFAADRPGVQWWLQPKGPETVHLLDTGGEVLSYALPEFGITMPFKPTDFTQVNPYINRVLVSRALRLLAVQRHERVIDWFCGLGNFTLPIATQARQVLGVEGSEALVARSRQNFKENQALAQSGRALSATDFVTRNLFEMTPSMLVGDGSADRWLVDPPREGAFALVRALADLHQQSLGTYEGEPIHGAPDWRPPRRIVYVSCNPSTLARDAGLLVHQAGYRCTAAGVVNMFPHTAHVESLAVFDLTESA